MNAARYNIMCKIDEADVANDPDLWAELDAKVTDVLIIYRRHLKTRRNGEAFTEERAHQLTEMAWNHAFAEAFGDEANDVDTN